MDAAARGPSTTRSCRLAVRAIREPTGTGTPPVAPFADEPSADDPDRPCGLCPGGTPWLWSAAVAPPAELAAPAPLHPASRTAETASRAAAWWVRCGWGRCRAVLIASSRGSPSWAWLEVGAGGGGPGSGTRGND